MATYLITGASRGIGLELARQLAELPASQVSKVFALARNTESKGIQHLVNSYPGHVIPVSASVDDTAGVNKAVETVRSALDGQGLDVLVNNAGIAEASSDGIKSMDVDGLTRSLDVNVVGVQRVTAAFMPLLEQGTEKKIFNMYVTLCPVRFEQQAKLTKIDKFFRVRFFCVQPVSSSCCYTLGFIRHLKGSLEHVDLEICKAVRRRWLYCRGHLTWSTY
jgi:short-subunit dehydrogenase involved in D-alanine esterification of teichoic acids